MVLYLQRSQLSRNVTPRGIRSRLSDFLPSSTPNRKPGAARKSRSRLRSRMDMLSIPSRAILRRSYGRGRHPQGLPRRPRRRPQRRPQRRLRLRHRLRSRFPSVGLSSRSSKRKFPSKQLRQLSWPSRRKKRETIDLLCSCSGRAWG
jgi:hypothetical protein